MTVSVTAPCRKVDVHLARVGGDDDLQVLPDEPLETGNRHAQLVFPDWNWDDEITGAGNTRLYSKRLCSMFFTTTERLGDCTAPAESSIIAR